MNLEILPKMQFAFLYELNDEGKKRAHERLDQFLEEKGLNPSQTKHYFYYLNMSKKSQKCIVYILYGLVGSGLLASGEISTITVQSGPYLVFDLSRDEVDMLASGCEEGFESQIKAGLITYKKTRVMDQLFALIEEVVQGHELSYRAYIPVR